MLIVILTISILILSGYIIYDKLLSNTNNNQNDKNNNIKNETLLNNNEAIEIVKSLTKKYFEYYHHLGPYCGNTNNEDYISFGSYETRDFRDYWASKTYNSIDEIKEYYKTFMTENLIPSYLDDSISYLEQDGKLYCQLSHKGCGDTYREEASKFTINTINDNTIISNAILVSETCGTELNKREGKITIIKNSKGDWLISEYDVVLSHID